MKKENKYVLVNKGSIVFFIIINFLMFVCFSILVFKDNNCISTNLSVDIPDRLMVNDFCKDSGYDFGWLDSSGCGKNEVRCYRDMGLGVSKNVCVKWS